MKTIIITSFDTYIHESQKTKTSGSHIPSPSVEHPNENILSDDRYYVDIMTEENDGFEGFGVFNNMNGFCKGTFIDKGEADRFCLKLNKK